MIAFQDKIETGKQKQTKKKEKKKSFLKQNDMGEGWFGGTLFWEQGQTDKMLFSIGNIRSARLDKKQIHRIKDLKSIIASTSTM